MNQAKKRTSTIRVLVLYNEYALATNFVREHLASYRRHLPYHVHYAAATHDTPLLFELQHFDVVILHFSVRIAFSWLMAPAFYEPLKTFAGLKLLFIQDEYDAPHHASRCIRELGFHTVFTCVPEADRAVFYPPALTGPVQFVHNLTGYVPHRLETRARPRRPIAQRHIHMGYRGRELPFRYGLLGREKRDIGVQMQALCQQQGVPHDIGWTETERINGNRWYRFLGRCRTMLSTESGCNVVDTDGTLARTIDEGLRQQPTLTFAEVFERWVKPHEGRVHMNQAPPKLFEAAALGTGLVLFEGTYSDVVQPGVHYFSLKKDYSNAAEIFAAIAGGSCLQQMVERTYEDLVASGRYSYRVLMRHVETLIEANVRPQPRGKLVYALVACDGTYLPGKALPFTKPLPAYQMPYFPAEHIPKPMKFRRLRKVLRYLPESVKKRLRWLAK